MGCMAAFLGLIGIIIITNAWMLNTENSIHQVYKQLIYLTGVIMLVGSFFVLSVEELKQRLKTDYKQNTKETEKEQ